MKAHRRNRQVVFLAKLADLDEVDKVLDLFLHGLEANQAVQLLHQLIEVRLLRLLFLRLRRTCASAGGLNLGTVLLYKARLSAGDKIQRVQSLTGLAHTGGIANGRQAVGTLGDELRFRIGYVVVYRRKIKQDIGQHPNKGSGGFRAALCVGFRQIPEKHGRQEDIFFTYGTGQVPQQPLRLLASAGVDLVRHLNMALSDPAGSAP